MSEGRPLLGILFTHGEMARGMVDAVSRIADTDAEAVVPVSNRGRTQEELASELDALMGERPSIVFTDLRTGSCAFVAQLVCKGRGQRAVVFGVNLAMLLDFVFHRELPIEEIVPRLIRKGRESMRAIPESLTRADSPVSG